MEAAHFSAIRTEMHQNLPKTNEESQVSQEEPKETTHEDPTRGEAMVPEKASNRRNKSRLSCCVPTCCTPGYVTADDGHQVTFHKLPVNNKEHLRDWIVKIKRDIGPSFKVTHHTRICSRHFETKDFRTTYKGKRFMKENAIPSRFSWNNWNRPIKPRSMRGTETVHNQETSASDEMPSSELIQGQPAGNTGEPSSSRENQFSQLQQRISELEAKLAKEQSKSCLLEKERNHVRDLLSKQMIEAKTLNFGLDLFKDKDSDICFYTGFPTYKSLSACFTFLDPANSLKEGSRKTHKDSKLSHKDQFFLTLVRLRLGLFEKDLADRFNISQSSVQRIFKLWVNFIYLKLGSVNIWPSQEQIQRTMPDSMKAKFPKLEWIIDAFEIQTQRPASLMLQSQSYSSYKSRNTVKGLIACTPSGQVGFISQLYTGNISDRELVVRSGFLNMQHNRGAVWLVDKGFQIQDLADPLGVTVNMPAFVGHKKQLNAQEVFQTQSIASERIHVERIINKIKKFHLFDRPIQMSMMGSINQAWTVCALLTLFQNPIISA